jgi:hypothetical protein
MEGASVDQHHQPIYAETLSCGGRQAVLQTPRM